MEAAQGSEDKEAAAALAQLEAQAAALKELEKRVSDSQVAGNSDDTELKLAAELDRWGRQSTVVIRVWRNHQYQYSSLHTSRATNCKPTREK